MHGLAARNYREVNSSLASESSSTGIMVDVPLSANEDSHPHHHHQERHNHQQQQLHLQNQLHAVSIDEDEDESLASGGDLAEQPRARKAPAASLPAPRDPHLAASSSSSTTATGTRNISGKSGAGARARVPTSPPVHIDHSLIPAIVRFLDPHDLHSCLTLSWLWFKAASTQLYAELVFSQLSARKLKLVLATLQASVVGSSRALGSSSSSSSSNAAAGATTGAASPAQAAVSAALAARTRNGSSNATSPSATTLVEYHTFVRSLVISQIVFEDPSATPLQSWYLVRDLLGLCAATIESISLTIGDESFMELPNDYLYLHTQAAFPRLKRLAVASRCMRLPEKLILELLRASPINGLTSIRLSRCLPNLGGAGWFLLSERGGSALEDLVLTPAIGPNMLGWDEQLYAAGLEQLARSCTHLRHLDLSGHSLAIPDRTLFLLLAHARDMLEIHMPCNLTDAHLVALLTNEPWSRLHTLDLACRCVDGAARERKPNGMSCNKFADSVILAVLDHLANGIAGTQPLATASNTTTTKTTPSSTPIPASSSSGARSTPLSATPESSSSNSFEAPRLPSKPAQPYIPAIRVPTRLVVYLPVYLVSVRTGKRIATIDWLSSTPEAVRIDQEAFVYKNLLRVEAPTDRHLITF